MVGQVEDLVGLQAAASSAYVFFTAGLLMLHNLGLGGCWVFGGLTLPGHRVNVTEGGNSTMERALIFLTEDEASTYISVVPFLTILGTLAGYPATEHLGRKPVLLITNILQISGFLVIIAASSFSTLMLGRSLTCVAAGLGVMVPFMMIRDRTIVTAVVPRNTRRCINILCSEVTTIVQRAPLSVINTLSMSAGILLSFLAAAALSARRS